MLAERLRHTIREEKRITIKEAARRAGLPRSSLEKLILGQRTDPHMSTLMAIAVGLNVSIDYLAGIDDAPPATVRTGEGGDVGSVSTGR